jgi:hypothetical protein
MAIVWKRKANSELAGTAKAAKAHNVLRNPRGGCEENSYDPHQPDIRIPRKVAKGSSQLCAPVDCRRYRCQHLIQERSILQQVISDFAVSCAGGLAWLLIDADDIKPELGRSKSVAIS